MIDKIDSEILNIIQHNARISNAEIARQVGLAPSATLERIRKLEERGVIRGYAAELDAAEIGFGLTAFISVKIRECCSETDQLLSEIPEVLEVHDIAGDYSYMLKVRVKDTKALSNLLREELTNVPNVVSTKTTVVLQTIKETTALPIRKGEEGAKLKKQKKK